MFRFVFSALYNEDAEYIDIFVSNVLHYTDPDVALIVNLGCDVPVPVDRDFGPRVRLIRGEVQRYAWPAVGSASTTQRHELIPSSLHCASMKAGVLAMSRQMKRKGRF